jgi:general stress protein 26
LATNENGKPRQRTVVLRKTLLDLSLVIYTDKRTKKDIQNNSEFSALFYDSKTITNSDRGKAELITDKEQIATYWHSTAGI